MVGLQDLVAYSWESIDPRRNFTGRARYNGAIQRYSRLSRLLVLGAGGHGAVVAEAAIEYRRWSELAFLDDELSNESILGLPVLGAVSHLESHLSEDTDVIVAVGNNAKRLDLLGRLAKLSCNIATVIHPTAIVSPSASIGAGSVLCAGVIVNARATISRGAILNTACTVDHDCILGDGVHVSPGVNLAGNVTIGARSIIVSA